MSEIILRHDGRTFFVAFPKPTNARYVVKEAGFLFDGGESRWVTTSIEAVMELLESGPTVTVEAARAIEVAKGAYEERKALASFSIDASAATDADVEIPAPAGLDYLPYQRAGIAYAMRRPDTLIADEMGLGKTIQAIGTVNADPSARRVLIVCPASLKLNWVREFRKWEVKGLSVAIGTAKKWPEANVVIVNYEIVGKLRSQIDAIAWDVLICDECHYLKNGKAARTKSVIGGGKERAKPIVSRRRLFLTGTPIVNRPSELWTLVKTLDPSGLGAMGWFGFGRRYCGGYDTRWGFEADGATHLDELQVKLRSSIMVRRLKRDVLKDLPAKRRQLLPLDPTPEIKRALKAMEESAKASEKRISELRAKAKGMPKNGNRDAYRDIAAQIREAGRLGFEEISKHRHELAVAKAPSVVEHVRETLESEDCLLVMAHHQDVVRIIVDALEADGVKCSVITGQTPVDQRQAQVDSFQGGDTRVFVGTIQAAGVGLTLTRASTVVFAELDWTPGAVSQAEDRVHRIGQKNAVLIQHLIVDESLDAKFVHLLIEKQANADKALDDGDPMAKVMAAEHLYFLPDTAPVEGTLSEERATDILEEEMEAHANEVYAAGERRHAAVIDLVLLAAPGAVEAAYEALAVVASYDDDHAQIENGVGFSKRDVRLGHALATLSSADRTTVKDGFALKFARIYRGQVDPRLAARFAVVSAEAVLRMRAAQLPAWPTSRAPRSASQAVQARRARGLPSPKLPPEVRRIFGLP